MKDIKLYMFEENGKKENGTKPKKIEYVDINFRHFLKKESSYIDYLGFKTDLYCDYKINIVTQVCYNIDNLNMYDFGNTEFGGSKEYDLLDKSISKFLDEKKWNIFDENSVEIFNQCCNLGTQETRLDSDYFEFEFIFDNFNEMLNFIISYEKSNPNYNILEDYYHIIFIKTNDYKNYLKTKFWEKKSKQIISKKNSKCQLCSNKNNLFIHHNTYENIGTEKEDDLIILCRECYNKFN